MKKIIIFLIFLFLFMNISFAINYKTSIYIRNKPYNDSRIIKNNNFYMPVNTLLRYLNYDWIQKGKDVFILGYRLPASSSEVVGRDLFYHFADKTFYVDNFVKDGRLFVNAHFFAKNMQFLAMYNDQTNIFDIVMPNQNAVQITSVTPIAGGGAAPSAGGETAKEPIVAAVQYYQDYNPAQQYAGGDLRGVLTVKNTGDKQVTGIVVNVYARTTGGENLNVQTYSIGTLKAGEETTKNYYWSNPNPLLVIKIETEVKHDPIPEEKKEEVAPAPAPTMTPTTTIQQGY